MLQSKSQRRRKAKNICCSPRTHAQSVKMTNYEIVSKEVVSNKEAFDIVKERTKEIEPTYREEKIVEFLNKFPLHTKKDYLALKKELEALELARLDEAYLIKIIDLMPKNGTELRAITSTSGSLIVDEDVKRILDVLAPYRK
ncbi:hypothetical protein H6501_05190 [Candidatus Woesearchaeota archaeon]|nr:hypothetical protein [Nanoarchaeota archaeon]MCB9370968.1 hypothetical protein [Candidatus Woesearchaeota archaeon]USN44964.1 MAG: hypothetical protein H6500_06805 [Candidatus Woesearchaeota archaeon]